LPECIYDRHKYNITRKSTRKRRSKKKIIQGLIFIILAVAVWTLSSWQLPVIVETVNCMFKDRPDKPCPFPTNENAPPYSSRKGKFDMDPFQAFLNIVMSTLHLVVD